MVGDDELKLRVVEVLRLVVESDEDILPNVVPLVVILEVVVGSARLEVGDDSLLEVVESSLVDVVVDEILLEVVATTSLHDLDIRWHNSGQNAEFHIDSLHRTARLGSWGIRYFW